MVNNNLLGGWALPLWKISVSWDDDIPNVWKNKIYVPNHQPVTIFEHDIHSQHTGKKYEIIKMYHGQNMGKMGYRHPTIIGNPYIGQCSVVSSWWCYDPQFWAHESTFDHGTDGNWETFCGILTFDPRISNFKGLSNCKSVPAPCVLAARRVRRAPRVPRVPRAPRAPRVRPLPCAAAVRAKDLGQQGWNSCCHMLKHAKGRLTSRCTTL